MNENSLILNAIKQIPPKQRKKRTMKKIEDLPLETGYDPIMKLSRKFRKKNPKEWTGQDFAKYFKDNLAVYGLECDTGVRDGDWMLRLYDSLSDMADEMNNIVLKDYIDWWCGNYAPRSTDKHVYVTILQNKHTLRRFIKQNYRKSILHKTPEKEKHSDVYALYDLGGLSAVLISRGIAIGYKILREKEVADPEEQIQKSLLTFSSEMLEKVMTITCKQTNYDKTFIVDFFSLAAPALKRHGIDKYFNKDYKSFFKET